MILFPRRRFEWALATALVAIVLTGALRRFDAMADDTNRQSIITLGAHFSAGIAMLQAEHRTKGGGPLNAFGYPVASDGRVSTDADCREVWHLVMQNESEVVARVNTGDDGSGSRCEFEPTLQTSVQGRVLYWPEGAAAYVASVSGRALTMTPGEHVYVDVGDARAVLPW